jgi:hypothetical protein
VFFIHIQLAGSTHCNAGQCTVNFVSSHVKSDDAEKQLQGRDTFFCRYSFDVNSKQFEPLPRRRGGSS